MSKLLPSTDTSAEPPPAGEDRRLLNVSVLAVDDLEDNLDLIEEYLEDEVWSVLRAQSGEEALDLAIKYLPDVIVLDLMMPRMNGLAVLRAIRSKSPAAHARDSANGLCRQGEHHHRTSPGL